LALSGAGQVLAGSVTIPNSFTSGSAALAAEVNANFDAVKSAVDDNDSRIAALVAQLDTLQTQVDAMDATVTLDSLVGATYCGISHWSILGSVSSNTYSRITTGEGTQTVTFTSTSQASISGSNDEEVELGWSWNGSDVTSLLTDTQTSGGGIVATINSLTNGVLSMDVGGVNLTLYVSRHGDVMIQTDGSVSDGSEGETSGSIWVRCQ
jgi:hypothetical protein